MKHLTLLLVIACLYDNNCPTGLSCVVNAAGIGECAIANSNQETITTGQHNRTCTFPSDCADNEICARPRGYQNFGTCRLGDRSKP